MSVEELIAELLKVEDKSKQIKNTNGVVLNEIEDFIDCVYIKN